MRTLPIIFTLLTVLTLSCKDTKKEETLVKVKTESAKTEVKEVSSALYEDLDGNSIDLADYRGKKLLLNYWATWCRPCIEEMPAMARAQKLLEEDNYVFLFASDQSVEKIKTFKEKRKFGLNFIKFNGAYGDLEITALPVTIIYSEAGEPLKRIEGGIEWDSPEMIQKLKNLK